MGLKAAPQGPVKVSETLANYIDNNMDEYGSDNLFPDSDNMDKCYEGAKLQVLVNKYERSSIARQRCIEHNGHCCFVCGIDFEKRYGEIGKNFIHIHHIVPLNEIGEEYKVDYKKDLIPVCPNCHAMLHRKINGEYVSWEELKDMIKKE
jgi:5-methylcytosine-specific restriction protein A